MTHQEAHDLAMEAFRRGTYAKNIDYAYTGKVDVEEFALIRRMAGSPGQSAYIIQHAYDRIGLQVHVSKQVSDELLSSDFAPATKFNDVPWPAKVCEIYFEDPRLPTMLVMKCSPGDIQKWFPEMTVMLQEPEYVSGMLQEDSGLSAKLLSLQLKPDMYDEFLNESTTSQMTDVSLLNKALNPQDNATFAVLMRLVLKVFAFGSIPHFKPAPITRKEMFFGGKPEVKGRPKRPAVRVFYAPNVRSIGADTETVPTGREIEFKGRRGHFRYFRSEFYTTMRNKWTYVRPVPGPDGTIPKIDVFKIRKPTPHV